MYPHFFAVFFLLFYIFSSHEITKLCVKFGSQSCLRKKGREKKKNDKKKKKETKAGQVGESISSVYIYVAPLLLSNFSTTRKGRKKPLAFFLFSSQYERYSSHVEGVQYLLRLLACLKVDRVLQRLDQLAVEAVHVHRSKAEQISLRLL